MAAWTGNTLKPSILSTSHLEYVMKKFSLLLKCGYFALFAGLFTSCIDSGGGGGGGSTGPQTVLVIGDSISGKTNYPGVPPWPSIVAAIVPEWTVVNRATGGEKLAGGRAKVGGLLASIQPDTLVIFYGSNNAIQGDVDSFGSDLAATIQAGITAGAKVAVCTVPFMYESRSIYNGRVAAINTTIRSVAGGLGAKVININGEFGSNSEALFPDGLHPNLDGQNIIAISVRERI